MGAGQIGGMATLLDLDFDNAAGFVGEVAKPVDAQYMVYYMSHSMLFCAGALLEAHVVLTPASCVFGELYKFEVYGGTHMILQGEGTTRIASDFCIHKGYNNTMDGAESQRCYEHNIALIVLDAQFILNHELKHSNRIRYGWPEDEISRYITSRGLICSYHGWGSRRNGFLVPLLFRLQKVEVFLLEKSKCDGMCLANEKSFLCLEHPPCVNDEQGSLCPDDLGTVLDCFGFARGLMVSRIIDRPCGAGFLDILIYLKFITCGIDDAREILETVPMNAKWPAPKNITPPHPNATTPLDVV